MSVTKGNTQFNQVVELASYNADIGAADAYVVTLRPAISSYTTGLKFKFQAAHANTGAATINVNSLGVKSIKKNVSTALAGGDILLNQIIEVIYDGTNFQILSGIGGTGGGTSGYSGYSGGIGGTGVSGYSGYSGISGQFPGVLYNRQTTNYTLVLGDSGKAVEMNSVSANTVTVPPSSSVAFPIGTEILISQYGSGQTSLVAGAGVTIDSVNGSLSLTSQFSAGTLSKVNTNEWYFWGDILPAANSGYSGFSGKSGFSGISGYSGANPGASGYSGFSGSVTALAINTQSGDYTLVLGDGTNTLIDMSKSTACILTIPTNASVALPLGCSIPCYASNTGQVTVTPAGGVTVHAADGSLRSRVQYSTWSLIKVATNTWLVSGDLTA